MERFHILDDAAVILRSKGVFRQAKVFRRGGELYASHGSGFIKLYASGGTSHPNVSWDAMDTCGYHYVTGRVGALTLEGAKIEKLAR